MKDLIVLDTETTGIDARRESIIEIAAAKISDGEIVAKWQTLVKPHTPLSVTVSVLTGIKPEDLVDAPDIQEAGQELLNFAGDLPIVGHNISFDLDFLKASGIDLPGQSLDTLDLAIVLLPKLPFHSMQFMADFYQLRNQPSHRAMSDVLATVELINLLVHFARDIPAPLLQKIRRLIPKSDWEWSFVFAEDIWTSSPPMFLPSRHAELTKHSLLRHPGSVQDRMYDSGVAPILRSPSFHPSLKSYGGQDGGLMPEAPQNDGEAVSLGEIKTGFNAWELPPDLPQIPVNIALATRDDQSILIVSQDIFHNWNWADYGLQPYFGSVNQLDADRFEFLLGKAKIKSTDFKLLIKILLTGYPKKTFNPADIYLTKDEFYLWEQKLAPFKLTVADLEPKTVMSFASFYELLENQPELFQDKYIYLPQWIEFDEWAAIKSTKIITELYLHAAVASRRDFIHDFINDNRIADELFKSLNNLGSQLNDWWQSVTDLWGSEANDQTLEINQLLASHPLGKLIGSQARDIAETLTKFSVGIGEFSITNQLAKERQMEHTNNLANYFRDLANPVPAAKIYLSGFADRVTMYIIRRPIVNIWQIKLKSLSIVFVSNGLLVNGRSGFLSNVIGEPVEIELIPSPLKNIEVGKQILITRDLPERKDEVYQFAIFDYLKNKLLKSNERTLVIFSNQAQTIEFFEGQRGQIEGVEILSQNVAGNVEILKNNLVGKPSFALLINNASVPKFLPVLENLDKVIFLTLPFDPPGTLGQVLAKERFKDEFSDYGLPRATVKFRNYLAELYFKTKEIWILDSRLANTDWGRTVPQSLSGFQVVEI